MATDLAYTDLGVQVRKTADGQWYEFGVWLDGAWVTIGNRKTGGVDDDIARAKDANASTPTVGLTADVRALQSAVSTLQSQVSALGTQPAATTTTTDANATTDATAADATAADAQTTA